MASNRQFEQKVDYYEGEFPKSKGVSKFHSWQELLFAGILEGDPDVLFFRSQGRSIHYRVNGKAKSYVPDFIVNYKNRATTIIEVKPRGLIDRKRWPWLPAVEAECRRNSTNFIFQTNEEIESRSNLAVNWIEISRYILSIPSSFKDDDQMGAAREAIRNLGSLTLRDLAQYFANHEEPMRTALTLYPLHQGYCTCDGLDHEPLHYNLRIKASVP